MPLIEETLFGRRNKVDIAIARLREHEPEDGYFLAFSGGKDSCTIKRLAEMAGVKYDAHYNMTTVDPPELVRFIKKYHPDVARDKPEMSMFRLILHSEFWPPMRQQRWCCRLLKERGGEGRLVLTGVRWQESPRRKQRQMIEPCFRGPKKVYLHPIIDWTESEVWEFIHVEHLPYCSLYDEGRTRVGCVLCPERTGQRWKDAERWPQYKKAYINTFDKLIQIRRDMGKKITFNTGKEMFDWWLSEKREKKQAQLTLFE